jgi:hypothetical protein
MAVAMPIAIPTFSVSRRRGTVDEIPEPNAAAGTGETGDFGSTDSQVEGHTVAGSSGAWNVKFGSTAGVKFTGIGGSSSFAGNGISAGSETGTAGGISKALVSVIEGPRSSAELPLTGTTNAGASVACPQLLQNRLPGTRADPHCLHVEPTKTGATADAPNLGSAVTGTSWPAG